MTPRPRSSASEPTRERSCRPRTRIVLWHRACATARVRHELEVDPIASSELAPWRSVPAARRFLFYSPDARGLGQLRRSLTLAAGLVEAFADAEVPLSTRP